MKKIAEMFSFFCYLYQQYFLFFLQITFGPFIFAIAFVYIFTYLKNFKIQSLKGSPDWIRQLQLEQK